MLTFCAPLGASLSSPVYGVIWYVCLVFEFFAVYLVWGYGYPRLIVVRCPGCFCLLLWKFVVCLYVLLVTPLLFVITVV